MSDRFRAHLAAELDKIRVVYFPVVPRGASRIRVQINAAHTPDQIGFAIEKFQKVARALNISGSPER